MRVELLYFDSCPGWQEMAGHLDELADELGFAWTPISVETPEAALVHGFHGSPSLHIDGADPFAAVEGGQAQAPEPEPGPRLPVVPAEGPVEELAGLVEIALAQRQLAPRGQSSGAPRGLAPGDLAPGRGPLQVVLPQGHT